MKAQIMVMERRNPIPTGWYWIDLLTPFQRDTWSDWLKANNTGPDDVKVQVRKSEGTWKLFQVKEPVPRWPVEAKLGFPTLAPYEEKTDRGDTVQRPDPEPDITDRFDPDSVGQSIEETADKAAHLAKWLSIGALVAGTSLVVVIGGSAVLVIRKLIR